MNKDNGMESNAHDDMPMTIDSRFAEYVKNDSEVETDNNEGIKDYIEKENVKCYQN